MTTDLVEHIERFLGRIEAGWTEDADGNTMPFQLVRSVPPAPANTSAFTTLGLARHALISRASAKCIHFELMLLAQRGDPNEPGMPSLLHQVASESIRTGYAVLRGEVLGPRGALVPSSALEALYVAAPAYLPDEFAVHQAPGQTTVFAWLVPITASEVTFVREQGWDAFESLLVEQNPDLCDWNRPAIV